MTDITVYETPSTLTFSYFEVVKEMHIVPVGKQTLSPKEITARCWRTIKFSVYNSVLVVNYGRNSFAPGTRSGRYNSERLTPHVAGIIATYLHPESLGKINSFLDKHFPDLEVKPLTTSEEYTAEDDMNFYRNNLLSDVQKQEAISLTLKIHAASFPVYGHFVDNRLSDGFYSDGYYDLLPKKFHRAKNYPTLLQELFGTYRKDLAKVVIGSKISAILEAASFKDLLDTDTLINGMRGETRFGTSEIIKNMDVLTDFPKSALKKIFLDSLTNNIDPILREDALEMAPWVPAEEQKLCSSWQELHDRGMASYSFTENGDNQIEHTADFERFFQNAKFSTHTVTPMRTAKSFIETGETMDVCVGSKPYITRAFKGEGYCFRLDTPDKKPEVLVEVMRSRRNEKLWRVNQVAGHSNKSISSELNSKITTELNKFITLESRN